MAQMQVIVHFLLLATAHFCSAESSFPLVRNTTIQSVLTFGDSIMDTGNNNYRLSVSKSNFPPYGRDFEGGKPTGRFSNGKVASDFLVEAFGLKELLPPYKDRSLADKDLLSGVSFASAGAGIDNLTSIVMGGVPWKEQLEEFIDYKEKVAAILGGEGGMQLLENSLIAVVIGSNDILATFYLTRLRSLQFDIDSYTTFLVSAATSFVKEIFGLGGRRIVVLGIPPVGCVPLIRFLLGGISRDCREDINRASQLYNRKLATEIMSISKKLRDATLVYIDLYTPFMDIIVNPAEYGIKVVSRGCCGTGSVELSYLCNKHSSHTCTDSSDYMFWDSVHPTERTSGILVDKLLKTYGHLLF